MFKKEKAIFAAGCFWGVQNEFDSLPGVISTKVGYTGGQTDNPSYKEVCTGSTGHAEAVEVIFNSEKISYKDLLKKFWEIHDPTQLNRQGPDLGSQYRSAIFFITNKQKKGALSSLSEQQKKLKQKIVTEITPSSIFYDAEEYHQKYFKKSGKS